jgi:hypothetical protein
VATFWRGPITSKKQAGEIIRWTGWIFVSLAMIPVVFSAYAPRFSVYFGFVTAILSLIILWKRSRVAAGILFGLMLLLTVLNLAALILALWYGSTIGASAYAGGFLLEAVVWIPLTLLTWRGFRATRAWPGLSRPQTPDGGGSVDEPRPLGPPWVT